MVKASVYPLIELTVLSRGARIELLGGRRLAMIASPAVHGWDILRGSSLLYLAFSTNEETTVPSSDNVRYLELACIQANVKISSQCLLSSSAASLPSRLLAFL